MRRRLHFKPGLQESIRQSQRGLDHLALLSGKPRVDIGAKEKVVRGPVNTAESEAPVQAAVNELLASHPRVWIALRMNGGMAWSEGGGPVWFYRLLRCAHEMPRDCLMTDNFGLLAVRHGVYGAEVRSIPFAIECKRPDWKGVSRGKSDAAIREQRQERFIESVRACGGVGGFARSADEALRIINDVERW